MRYIVIHDRKQESDQIVSALQSATMPGADSNIVVWRDSSSLDPQAIVTDAIVIIHAAFEDAAGLRNAERLVEQFASEQPGSVGGIFAECGTRLKSVGAHGIVVVSNSLHSSEQILAPGWRKVWPATVGQFCSLVKAFLNGLGSGVDPAPRFFPDAEADANRMFRGTPVPPSDRALPEIDLSRPEWRGLPDRIVVQLRTLHHSCERWNRCRETLPERMERFTVAIQNGVQAVDAGTPGRVSAVMAALTLLQQQLQSQPLQANSLIPLQAQINAALAGERESPDYRKRGTLFSFLHGHLEGCVNDLINGPGYIFCLADNCLAGISAAPSLIQDDAACLLQCIQTAAQSWNAQRFSLATRQLGDILDLNPLRPLAQMRIRTPSAAWRDWTILCVEDDRDDQEAVARSVEEVRLQLGKAYTIHYEWLKSRQSAEARLRALTRNAFGSGPGTNGGSRPLLILDIGIPADDATLDVPSREEGIELLKCAYQAGVPTIVLTTPPNFLGDHRQAHEHGVEHYLLKGIAQPNDLPGLLVSMITDHPRRRIQLRDKPFAPVPDEVDLEQRFTIDGIEVTLEPSVFLTFRELLYRQHEDPHDPTITAFEIALERCASDQADQEKVVDNEVENVKKHIHEIRKAIKHAFSKAGRHIWPEEEIIVTTTSEDGEFAYKLVAEIIWPEETAPHRASTGRFRILVVENDIEVWQIPIVNLLERYGFEVQAACSVMGAIEQARQFKPHLLCLDMHLPRTQEEFDADPFDGIADGGITVFKSIIGFRPNVRALAFTDRVNEDHLRRAAEQAGLNVRHFVSKLSDAASSSWQSQLIYHVLHIKRELASGAIQPLSDAQYLPYIEIGQVNSKGKQGIKISFCGKPWELRGKQLSLLLALARHAPDPVPMEELERVIYGEGADRRGALRQLAKFVRDKIEDAVKQSCQTLGVRPGADTEAIAKQILAESPVGGYMLNAQVNIKQG